LSRSAAPKGTRISCTEKNRLPIEKKQLGSKKSGEAVVFSAAGELGQSGWFKRKFFLSAGLVAKKTIFFGQLPKNLRAKKLLCLPTIYYQTAPS
jgi:hypothetical protein